MKNRAVSVFATLLLAVTAGVASGASPDGDIYAGWLKPGPPPLERFVKPLGLSAAQQQKLKPIFADAQARAAQDVADKAKKSATPAGTDATLSMRDADLRVQLATVLTPEQLAKFQQLTASRAATARTLTPHPAHGHKEMDSPATARDVPDAPASPAK